MSGDWQRSRYNVVGLAPTTVDTRRLLYDKTCGTTRAKAGYCKLRQIGTCLLKKKQTNMTEPVPYDPKRYRNWEEEANSGRRPK